ncbi:MAG: PEGA domain-containing protein [Myxococcota bacterium]
MQRWAAATILVTLWPMAAAQADDAWLVLPVDLGQDDAWIEPTTRQIDDALVAESIEAWPPDRATTRFETAGSASATEVSDGEVAAWVEQSSQAIRNLAEGDYATALDQLKEAQALSRDAAEELNRQQERATRTLDTCLYMVRVLLDTGAESQAKSMVQECRRLVPRTAPTKYMHPPEVRKLLSEVDATRRSRARRIEVTSNPEGCAVRVNGVILGKTPITLRDLFPGRYRVQVECDPDRRGRVHVVDLTTSSETLSVDARFDRTVSTKPSLHLDYASTEDEERYRLGDAAAVAEVVPAETVLLVSMPTRDVMALALLQGSPLRQVGAARVPVRPEATEDRALRRALTMLQTGECADLTVEPPAPLPCRSAPARSTNGVDAPKRPYRMPPKTFKAGMALAAMGSASLLTGYILIAPRTNAANDWLATLPNASAQNRWIRTDNALLWSAGIGATFLTTAMPMILPKRSGVPWPAWLSGAIGVGAVAFSLGYGLTGEKPAVSCRGTDAISDLTAAEACVVRAERVDAAFLAGVTGAPLIAAPLTYLFRRSDKRLEPEVHVNRSLAAVSLKGRW